MAKLYAQNGGVAYTDAPGTIFFFAGDAPPEGALACNGALVNRATYPKLFAAIGTKYSAGDGSTTFGLPNTEDRFPRFAGNGLSVGETQGDAIRNITGSLSAIYNTTQAGNGAGVLNFVATSMYVASLSAGDGRVGVVFNAANVVPTADENRPKAIAFMACITY